MAVGVSLMSGTLDEFRDVFAELTAADSDFGEDMTMVEDGLTAASFGIGTSGSASVAYDAARGGYVATAALPGSGSSSASSLVETPFRGILAGVVKQPRATDEAVQSGSARIICPQITRADASVLQPVIGNHVRTARGTYQIIGVSPYHVQGGTAGWRLVLEA